MTNLCLTARDLEQVWGWGPASVDGSAISKGVMMSDGGGLPPAGWYDDPEVPGGQRYWDGSAWGEQRPPAPSQPEWTPPTPASGSWSGDSGGFSAAGAGAGGATAPLDTWLWQSIAVTVFCCLPLGIVAIVKSAQAGSARDAGNLALAQTRAGEARTWTMWSFGVGLVAIGIWVVFAVFLGARGF